MRIFLTGASGMVGAAFARAAVAAGHAVTGTVFRHRTVLPGLAPPPLVLDLTDPTATATALHAAKPEVLVNCAAVSEPPACLLDPTGSEALNVRLPLWLARHAERTGTRLLHLSSEQVFDGKCTEPYAVTDPPRPLNLYGQQKLAAEQAVLVTAPEQALVVRLPLLTGNSANRGRSLHERLFHDWKEGRIPRLFSDELRQTCSASNVAGVLLALCNRPDLHGLRQWAGAELLSRLELGRRIRTHFSLGESTAPLEAVARAEALAVAASRPACLALAVEPLATELGLTPQGFAAQLAELTVPPACAEWYQLHRP